LEATRGHRRRTDAQTGGHERRARIVRHGILVHSDERATQCSIGILTSDVLLDQRQQEQVVQSTARYHIKTALDEYFGHRLGILHYLLLIDLELVAHGFFEADRLGRDHVHQRAALTTGED